MQITLDIVVIGAFTGLAYAVMGAGLVLIYRSTRVINFAQGEIGALAAAVLAKLVLDLDWNWFVAFALAGVIGAALGALWELTVIRRLFDAPRLILLVATIGIAQVTFVGQLLVPGVERVQPFPRAIDREAEILGVALRGEHFFMIAFVPAIIVFLTLFLQKTPYGRAIRAAADNPDAAQLAGISVRRVSTIVWALAGLLAATTFVAIAPVRGVLAGTASAALGPGLMVRALAAALLGRLGSFPLTVVGGLGLGILEAIIITNVDSADAIGFWLFVIVLALVLLRGQNVNDAAGGSFSLTPRIAAVPSRLLAVPWVRRLPLIVSGVSALLAVALPLVVTAPSQHFLFAQMFIFAIIGLSVVVLTGWAGQLSLGQFAFVGIGAMVTASLTARGMPFLVAAAYATLAGILVALAIGRPALRIRGLFLAVTTLAFALAGAWIFSLEFLSTGSSIDVAAERGRIWFVDLDDQRAYYYLCMAAFALVTLGVSRLRSTGIGRRIVAVRDNEQSAAAYGVSPAGAKLTAFGLSGGVAALGGALLAGLHTRFALELFAVDESLRIVSMTIIGGLGSVAGAALGAVYLLGLPTLLGDSQEVRLMTSGIGLLVLLLYLPGGLAQVAFKLRDQLLGFADRSLRDADAATTQVPPRPTPSGAAVMPRQPQSDTDDVLAGTPAVAVSGVSISFGGVRAVDDVTLHANAGETLGLIGSNGAGKSTLLNVVSGFLSPDAGTIEVFGEDVTALAPDERARRGLGRVFQDARLFSNLTVRETVMVALEGRHRSELLPSLLALYPSRVTERAQRADADELLAFLGLGRFAGQFVSNLSTGTRRIVELACLVALQPAVILLDEPTAGVAQRETEAFGPLIDSIKSDLGATLVLIEHDMPLVMSLSDRIYCMASGRVIAEGPPEQVRNDPKVIAAYLGTDERAIERSDARKRTAKSAR